MEKVLFHFYKATQFCEPCSLCFSLNSNSASMNLAFFTALPACSASVVNTEEGVEGYNADSEEESAYCVDDNNLDAAEDDRIVELSESEDGEDTESGDDGSQKINDDIAVQYEIIPTSLGDCGCASNNQSYKKRYLFADCHYFTCVVAFSSGQ